MRWWAWTNVGATMAVFAGTLAVLVCTARREGRVTRELGLFVGALSIGWMEAVLCWGAYLYYSPTWPHFPTGWPIVRLIPILPLHIPLAYTWFFFGGAWLAVRLAARIHGRRPSWSEVPLLLTTGAAVGFIFGAVVENIYIPLSGLWTYTQTWAPLTLRAGSDSQWPVYMDLAMAAAIAPFTYFLGRSSPASRSRPAVRTLASWVVLCHVVYGTVSFGYVVLRWTGLQTSVSTVQPYPDERPLYDHDVTRPDDPAVNREPIRKAR